jgi:Rod binding domain-containing protein
MTRHEAVPLERLANDPGLTERAKVAQASQQFEAALLRQILSDARKPVFVSEFTKQSAVDGIYHDLITNQLAESISQSGEFGLARSLQAQLDRTVTEAPATAEPAASLTEPLKSVSSS